MRLKLMILFVLLPLMMRLQAQGLPVLEVGGDEELGGYLVTQEGFTVYIFTNDGPNESTCTDQCLERWPAVTVESADALAAGEGIVGGLGVIEREDTGAFQVTYNRQPLYTFVDDTEPGVTAGEGVGDVWFVARPQIITVGGNDEFGQFLTNANQQTLYIFTNDAEGVSNCTDGCLEAWPPLTINNEAELYAGLGAAQQADLAVITREDTGVLQVTYQGQPLYTFADDVNPGDALGEGRNDVWFIIKPPVLQTADHGELGQILVGNDGMTLYTFAEDEAGVSNCVDNCAVAWPPLTVISEADLATAQAALPGEVGTITRDNGDLQVTYNGSPLYFWFRDGLPGDTNGQNVGEVWFVAPVGEGEVSASTAVCTVNSASNVNLRGGPGTQYNIAGSFLPTETRNVIGQAVDAQNFVWWALDGDSWVRSDVVTATGSCDTVPFVAAPPSPPTAVPVPATQAPANTAAPAQPPVDAPQPTQVPEQPAPPTQAPPVVPPPQTTEEV